jgi:hypothetical protein
MSTEEWLNSRPSAEELAKAAAVIDRLTPAEQRAMLVRCYAVMSAYQGTHDVSRLTRLAADFVATAHMRPLPGYREALAASRPHQH